MIDVLNWFTESWWRVFGLVLFGIALNVLIYDVTVLITNALKVKWSKK